MDKFIEMQEHKLLYHIVLTIHNSRTSKRMREYRILNQNPKFISLEEEICLTRIIGNIILELNLNCYAYNICRDHVHLIIQCNRSELHQKIRIIKGKSSYLLKRTLKDRWNNPLWSQKFFSANLDNWSIGNVNSLSGFKENHTYFQRAISYIENNRSKHGLKESQELQNAIKSFVKRELV